MKEFFITKLCLVESSETIEVNYDDLEDDWFQVLSNGDSCGVFTLDQLKKVYEMAEFMFKHKNKGGVTIDV